VLVPDDLLVLLAERKAFEDVLVRRLGPAGVVQLLHPRVVVGGDGRRAVRRVPEQREHPAGPQHARDLTDGRVVGEPVERLTREDRVDRCVLERDRLRRAGANVRFGDANGEQLAQLVERLDRDHARVARGKDLRELARPRTEVEHGRVAIERQQVEDSPWVARATAVVLRRRATERLVLLDQPTPASRNARFSFSISRAITSRWIWFVPS